MGNRAFMKMRDLAGYFFISELDNFDRDNIFRQLRNRYPNLPDGSIHPANPLDRIKDISVTRLRDNNSARIIRAYFDKGVVYKEVSLESGYVKNSIFISEIVINLSDVAIGAYQMDESLTPARENIQLYFSKISVRGI